MVTESVIPCTGSGWRGLRRNVLPRVAQLPGGLDFTAAMSARAVLSDSRVVEVSIPYERRLGRSKLSVVKDGIRVLVAVLASARTVRSGRRAGREGALTPSLDDGPRAAEREAIGRAAVRARPSLRRRKGRRTWSRVDSHPEGRECPDANACR
jgi:hypothetical protein